MFVYGMGIEAMERDGMSMRAMILILLSLATVFCERSVVATEASGAASTEITVVVGAAGTNEYAEMFSQWTEHWKTIAKRAGVPIVTIGDAKSETSDRQTLETRLQAIRDSQATHWIVLIGHGTYQRGVSKFNLRGPDVAAEEIAEWLKSQDNGADDLDTRGPMVIVNCTSSSGPFVNALSAPGRVIVTATQSGTEQNFARFGKFFTDALRSSDSDLDHDREVSVLEAFLSASKQTQRFYDTEARIATEHALIDDNGDGLGTRAEAFRGTRPIAMAKDGAEVDGKAARRITLAVGDESSDTKPVLLSKEQTVARDQLELKVEALRDKKDAMSEADYYSELESLMVELAKIYHPASE